MSRTNGHYDPDFSDRHINPQPIQRQSGGEPPSEKKGCWPFVFIMLSLPALGLAGLTEIVWRWTA